MQELYVVAEANYGKPWNLGYVINGCLQSQWIPAPDCRSCRGGGTGMSYGRNLPTAFEKELNRLPANPQRRRDISLPELAGLRKTWAKYCASMFDEEELPYGADFPPWRWVVPSVPSASGFYWCLGQVVIGSAVLRCFENFGVRGISYSPVELLGVGTLDPTQTHNIPPTDDMSQLLAASQNIADPRSVGDFVFVEPSLNTWREQLTTICGGRCELCGRRIILQEKSEAFEEQQEKWTRRRVLPKRFAPDTDLFESHVYSSFVVSPQLHETILSHRLTNFHSFKIKVIA